MHLLRALWAASIWHPTAIPPHERKYATPLKRVVLPVYDLILILIGWLGMDEGFEALRLAFPPPGAHLTYGVLIVAGLVCLIGCAFPRLWVTEVAGKLVVMGVLGVILFAMLVAGQTVQGHAGVAAAPMIAGLMLLPLLRLWILGVERAARRYPWSG